MIPEAIALSGSSNATTRDKYKPGEYEEGGQTQEESWVMVSHPKFGLSRVSIYWHSAGVD